MQKPNNFDNVSTGDFTPVTPGGHHLIIKKVEETKSKAGKDMIVVAFDMAPGDSQPNYISKLFADDIRPDKKWPRVGRQYIVVTDSDGNTSRSFKTFITCVENSNPGVQLWNGNTLNLLAFKGKKIGGVFGIVEEEYNGEVKQRHKLRWFCEDARADEANVPEAKLLNKPVKALTDNGFVNVPDGVAEEIPF